MAGSPSEKRTNSLVGGFFDSSLKHMPNFDQRAQGLEDSGSVMAKEGGRKRSWKWQLPPPLAKRVYTLTQSDATPIPHQHPDWALGEKKDVETATPLSL